MYKLYIISIILVIVYSYIFPKKSFYQKPKINNKNMIFMQYHIYSSIIFPNRHISDSINLLQTPELWSFTFIWNSKIQYSKYKFVYIIGK